MATLALALPRCAAAPAAKSTSRAHRKAHKESVRTKKHAADRRDRLSAGAAIGTGDAALLDATAGMCNFMETEAFEEYFSGEANDTRWDLGSMEGLFHGDKGFEPKTRMLLRAFWARAALSARVCAANRVCASCRLRAAALAVPALAHRTSALSATELACFLALFAQD